MDFTNVPREYWSNNNIGGKELCITDLWIGQVGWIGSQMVKVRNSRGYSRCCKSYIKNENVALLTSNLFVTSKNETTNSPIHEFKVLHKGQRAF